MTSVLAHLFVVDLFGESAARPVLARTETKTSLRSDARDKCTAMIWIRQMDVVRLKPLLALDEDIYTMQLKMFEKGTTRV